MPTFQTVSNNLEEVKYNIDNILNDFNSLKMSNEY